MAVRKTVANGVKECRLGGLLHREDGPAIECVDGSKRCAATYQHGKLHREDGPAIEYPDGTKRWFINGKLYRKDYPAIEQPDGTKHWYINGNRHREDGPASEYPGGSKHWYLHGKLHRLDGPAVEYANGNKSWYLHGERHRLDGPAIEWLQSGRKEWYFEGYWITEEQHSRIRSRIERVEKARAHRIKWFILDRLLPRLCSPHSAAFLKRFHADWDAALTT